MGYSLRGIKESDMTQQHISTSWMTKGVPPGDARAACPWEQGSLEGPCPSRSRRSSGAARDTGSSPATCTLCDALSV